MTVQEVKKRLEALHYRIVHSVFCNKVHNAELEALNIAIECMEELEQYRALGTVEELKEAREKQKSRREWYQKGYQDGLNADKWIPCEERLPNKFDYVLATFEQEDGYSTVDVLLCIDKQFYYPEDAIGYKGKKSVEVTAWQPLPDPYKKEGAE